MERFVMSAPEPQGHRVYPATVSPLSASSPDSPTSVELASIPFSAIQSVSDLEEFSDHKTNESTVVPPTELESHASISNSGVLSEQQLIARGKVLLQSYQIQKKQWLASGKNDTVSSSEAHDSDASVNIFEVTNTSKRDYCTEDLSSPVKRAVAHLNLTEAPSIDTKSQLSSNTFLPSTTLSDLSTFSIGPLPASKLIMHEPLSNNRSERFWMDFMDLLKTNRRTMEKMDAQLARLWIELIAVNTNKRGLQNETDKVSDAVTQLFQQKREAEVAILKLAEVLGSRVFLTGKLSDEAVQFVSKQLRLELEASEALIDKVQAVEGINSNRDLGTSVTGEVEMVKKLKQQLQHKVEQFQASQAVIAKLTDQLERQKNDAATRYAEFKRALEVKLREVDALCSDIDVPEAFEQIKTSEGILYYKKKENDGMFELEDPRVSLVIQQRQNKTKERACIAFEEVESSRPHRRRGVSALAREYAARDNAIRRSNSTPHIFNDNLVIEDIQIPPDDGRKHTIDDFTTPLPAGWEMRVTASGAVFFFNKYTTVTTWADPRLLNPASSPLVADTVTLQKPVALDSIDMTSELQPSTSNSTFVDMDSFSRHEQDTARYFDVVFEESGSIGIHFQANVLDAGAVVRNLLPDMAAAQKKVLKPFDELVAVNKTAVDSAPFRHIMLLLQGGLRPLTLSFKRNMNCSERTLPPFTPETIATMSDCGSSINDVSETHLDEEVLMDEGIVVDLEQLRVPVTQLQTSAVPPREDDMGVADVIISNLFSLFWKPPDLTSALNTV
ncbi:putative WW domain, PDZ domain, WW domain superfamily, PDZ superfamily protein [Plasmopara halstedii]